MLEPAVPHRQPTVLNLFAELPMDIFKSIHTGNKDLRSLFHSDTSRIGGVGLGCGGVICLSSTGAMNKPHDLQ